MSVESREGEMEVMDLTARERVLEDPDMLDIIFSYLDQRSVKTVRRVPRSGSNSSNDNEFERLFTFQQTVEVCQ